MVLYFTDIMGKMVAMCQKTSDKYFCINFWPCKEICMRNKYMTETQCLGGSTIHSLVTFLKTKITLDYLGLRLSTSVCLDEISTAIQHSFIKKSKVFVNLEFYFSVEN